MKKNVGFIDRIVRIFCGIAIITAGYLYETWWGGVGLIALVTGLLGFCPIYHLLGLATTPDDSVTR